MEQQYDRVLATLKNLVADLTNVSSEQWKKHYTARQRRSIVRAQNFLKQLKSETDGKDENRIQ